MFGAILGDMIGSPYEFDMGDKTKFFPLFSKSHQSSVRTCNGIPIYNKCQPILNVKHTLTIMVQYIIEINTNLYHFLPHTQENTNNIILLIGTAYTKHNHL